MSLESNERRRFELDDCGFDEVPARYRKRVVQTAAGLEGVVEYT